MSNTKLRIHNTETDNLISNLRGEVGEIISTWVLMKYFMAQANQLRTPDYAKDMENPHLGLLNTIIDKFEDEVIARLAELAEQKIGRLTFHFAHLKLNALEKESIAFTRFIRKNRFEEKRNYDISHKELPEKWIEHRSINIPYTVVLRAIAHAFRLMKKFDTIHLGPRAKYLWRENRRRRYKPMYPAKVGYMILPYLWLSNEDRSGIIQEEMNEGRDIWKDMPIKINGKEVIVKTYGEFGALILGGRIVLLDSPFTELKSIDFPVEKQE